MKKQTLLLFITLSFVMFSNAQLDLSGLQYGVKAGGNISTAIGDLNTKPIYGFHVGGYFQAELTEDFFVKPELLFSKEGFIIDNNDDNEAKVDLNYLALNLLVKYYTTEEFGFEAGLNISYLLSGKTELNTSSAFDNESFIPELSKFNLGGVVGCFYELDNGLNFSARILYGIGSVYKSEADGFEIDIDQPNYIRGMGQLSVGYTFL